MPLGLIHKRSLGVALALAIAASVTPVSTYAAGGSTNKKCFGPQCECTCDHIKAIEQEIADAKWLAERHTKKQLEMRDKEHAAAREHGTHAPAYRNKIDQYWTQYNKWAKHKLPKEFSSGRDYQSVASVQFDGEKKQPDAKQLKEAKDSSACQLIARRLVRHEQAHAAARKDGGGNTLPSELASEERFIYLGDVEFLKIGLEQLKPQCKGRAFGPISFVAHLAGGVTMTQTISGKNCRDPLADTWEMKQSLVTSGIPIAMPSKDSRSDSECLAPDSPAIPKRVKALRGSAGGGWFCIYDAGPPQTVTLRLYSHPRMGYKPPEQAQTVPITVGSCE